ncbi:TPA: phage tail assembly protein T [Escherichia coli]|nr:phage tail assembly protein T [Escherichia coli]
MLFVMRLAREFRRPDWRRMLAGMSASELGEWGNYFCTQSFSDVWLDAQFSTLKALVVQMVSGKRVTADTFSLIPTDTVSPRRTDDELMSLGEGIAGGMRFEPDR